MQEIGQCLVFKSLFSAKMRQNTICAYTPFTFESLIKEAFEKESQDCINYSTIVCPLSGNKNESESTCTYTIGDAMLRVWALAFALVVGCTIVYFANGFLGENAVKFASVTIGAAAAAAYLKGGVALSRAIYLLVGALLGALGFGIGAMALSDNVWGVYVGAIIPIVIAAIIAMWSKKQEVLLTLVLGIGAFGAAFTTQFFTDPQGINYTLPITLGQTIFLLGIGYFLAAITRTFFGSQPKDQNTSGTTPSPDTDDAETSQLDILNGADSSAASDVKNDQGAMA